MNPRPWMAAVLTAWTLAAGTAGAPALADESADALFQARLAWQIALDRAHFSPGVIDSKIGSRVLLATREFQSANGLPVTGVLDDATRQALNFDPDTALAVYTVQAADLAALGPAPKSWLAKSNLPRLGYASLPEMLAEKFHCTRALLALLNAGTDLASLSAGSEIRVPNVGVSPPSAQAVRVDVNLAQRVVRAYSAEGRLVGLFHCSVAAKKENLPRGTARVVAVALDPTYLFDPKKWPEVKGVNRKLRIPPGPRNPVGACWIGLSLRGYGLHGTPNPELIGKTGSHGCIRMTNWDARTLAGMVRPGTTVQFLNA